MGLGGLVDDNDDEQDEETNTSEDDPFGVESNPNISSDFTPDDSVESPMDDFDYSDAQVDREDIAKLKNIEASLKDRALNHDIDVTVEDGRIEGDLHDMALLFAISTLDVDGADLIKLAG
jgi:hypothetical protein